MTLVLDAGAFVALERRDRDVIGLLSEALAEDRRVMTHACVVGQVWRGGHGRQAMLARYLRSIDVLSIDDDVGRRAGLLMGRTRTSDVVDAALVILAPDGSEILTSDPGDLTRLAYEAGAQVDVIPV